MKDIALKTIKLIKSYENFSDLTISLERKSQHVPYKIVVELNSIDYTLVNLVENSFNTKDSKVVSALTNTDEYTQIIGTITGSGAFAPRLCIAYKIVSIDNSIDMGRKYGTRSNFTFSFIVEFDKFIYKYKRPKTIVKKSNKLIEVYNKSNDLILDKIKEFIGKAGAQETGYSEISIPTLENTLRVLEIKSNGTTRPVVDLRIIS